ncbi:CaiB/BaiF CoA transferase family protein [Streptomyces albipurpureus]|uniref:CoA transferase n=1 Tax=Streptomyces albipurpureus TaxID=2897419 RepID=A0ABT0UZK6_9ACTN|nr:CaiB/BaiF CoA-transferase family protein [Streptomyces sp. CWNU-1]MCM2393399.1 CoA transferase [Streptomyces sp. CWNU-1]
MSTVHSWSFLAGKRILDLSRLLPGPFATSLLADLGAEVIKIEDPDGGDPARAHREHFSNLNRNKRSVTLDLRSPADRSALLRLVKGADAVVESFRPGVLDKIGVGYEVLSRANPGIVLCSLTGYGQSGPYADKPGHELNFLGQSGFFAVPSRPDGQVLRPGVRVGDLIGSMYAALALSVALASAERAGQGQHIDLSLTEAATAWCAPYVFPLRHLDDATDSTTVQGDNDSFTTADGRVLSLATFEDKFWHSFRTALSDEFPQLGTTAYDRRAARTAAKREVGELLVGVFASRDYAWWEKRLTELNVPWGPVYTDAAQLLGDPHTQARAMFADIPDPATGTSSPQVRFPVRFGLGMETFRDPAPGLGEHNDEVLGGSQGEPGAVSESNPAAQ